MRFMTGLPWAGLDGGRLPPVIPLLAVAAAVTTRDRAHDFAQEIRPPGTDDGEQDARCRSCGGAFRSRLGGLVMLPPEVVASPVLAWAEEMAAANGAAYC